MTFLVAVGLGLIAIPVWKLTSAPATVATAVDDGRAPVVDGLESVELLVWVSHVPANVVVGQDGRELAVFSFDADGMQEVIEQVDVAITGDAVSLDVTADFSGVTGADESAVEIGVLRDGAEKRTTFFRVSGYADERVRVDVPHE